MAKLSRLAGSTGHILTIFVQDSSSTTGAGLTGLTNASSGLTCYYKRNTGTGSVAVTLASITTLGTWVSGGFKEIDATNMPGLYEFDPPDAAYATGAKSVVFELKGATNMAPVLIEIELTATDNQDATNGGLTSLATLTSRVTQAILFDASGYVKADPMVDSPGVTSMNTRLTQANLQAWAGTGVWTDATTSDFTVSGTPGYAFANPATLPAVDANGRVDVSKYLGQSVTLDANNKLSVNVADWLGAVAPAVGSVGATPAQNVAALLAQVIEPATGGGTNVNVQALLEFLGAISVGNVTKDSSGNYVFAAAGNPSVTRYTATLASGGTRTMVTSP